MCCLSYIEWTHIILSCFTHKLYVKCIRCHFGSRTSSTPFCSLSAASAERTLSLALHRALRHQRPGVDSSATRFNSSTAQPPSWPDLSPFPGTERDRPQAKIPPAWIVWLAFVIQSLAAWVIYTKNFSTPEIFLFYPPNWRLELYLKDTSRPAEYLR